MCSNLGEKEKLPMNEGPLCIHEIKLVVESSPGLRDGSGVGQHADRPTNLYR